MTNTPNTPATEGKVAAAVTRHAAEITETQTFVLAGQKAAFHSAIYVALTMCKLVYLAPEGEAIKAEDARFILTGSLKASKDANDDFIQRTFAAGTKLGLYLKANPSVMALAAQRNSLSTAVDTLADHLSAQHGVRDRKALVSFLTKTPVKKVDLHPGSTLAAKVVNKLAASDAVDFAKGLVNSLTPEVRAIVVREVAKANADILALTVGTGLAGEPEMLDRTGTEG